MEDARCGVCPRCFVRTALTTLSSEEDLDDESPDSIRLLLADGTTAAPLLRELGDYELLEELGHGGMGVIFKARQRSLDRIVALKVIRAGSLARPDDIARFRTEAAAAARLQHPNIVAIYEVGEHAGQPFYSMEFVPGRSLAQELLQGPCTPREAARLLQTVAQAIHFAHQRGILHRDLKPSNILLDARRHPRVADFGLAKLLHSDSELTVSGAVIGSPHYMSPEQADGRSAKAGPSSDVYSLGAILYELLTGRPPFSAPTPLETMKLVAGQEPIPPRALNPALPLDLDTLCLKCLAKEPSARCASAQEFADELGRFLRDEPIHARRVTPLERGWRWCRRKPALAALGAVLVVAPAAIIAVLLAMGNRVSRERNRSVAQLYAADVSLAGRALSEQDYGTAWRALSAHLPTSVGAPVSSEQLGFEWRWLWQRAQGDARKAFAAHLSLVNMITYSPDGRFVVSASSDGTAKLWDSEREECLRTFEQPGDPAHLHAYSDQSIELDSPLQTLSASFSADGRTLLIGSSRLILWDLATGQPRWSLPTSELRCSVCSPTDASLALARRVYQPTNLVFVDIASGRPSALFTNCRADAVCFTPDGRQFARWDRETHRLWLQTVPTGSVAASFDTGRTYVIALAAAPDGQTLAAGNMTQGTIELFDVKTQSRAGQLGGGTGRLRTIAISPDGRWLASGGFDQAIHIWDLSTRREVRQLHGHRAAIWSLAFSPDSRRIASGGYDGTVRFWDVAPSDPAPPLTNVFGVFAFSPTGDRLLTQGTNGHARLWELANRRLVMEWSTPIFAGASFVLSGELLLASTESSNLSACVRSFDFAASGGAAPVFLRDVPSPCSAITLSSDGVLAATGHQDGTVALWDAHSGRLLRESAREFRNVTPFIPPTEVNALALSGDLQSLAAATFNPVGVRTWSLPTWRRRGSRWFGSIYPVSLAISADGSRIATSGTGQGLSVNIWDATLRTREMNLRGHLDVPTAIAFSTDGHTLATGGADGLLKLWHLDTQREVAILLKLETGSQFVTVIFSPDGAWLAAADNHGFLYLFHAPEPSEAQAANAR
jgi:eukaryotic-like serine/threonine-protein kinase